jgi:hypothetical protein
VWKEAQAADGGKKFLKFRALYVKTIYHTMTSHVVTVDGKLPHTVCVCTYTMYTDFCTSSYQAEESAFLKQTDGLGSPGQSIFRKNGIQAGRHSPLSRSSPLAAKSPLGRCV